MIASCSERRGRLGGRCRRASAATLLAFAVFLLLPAGLRAQNPTRTPIPTRTANPTRTTPPTRTPRVPVATRTPIQFVTATRTPTLRPGVATSTPTLRPGVATFTPSARPSPPTSTPRPVVISNIEFRAGDEFAAGTRPSAMAVADLNRDGFPDVVFASRSLNTLTIALGAPLSAFVPGPLVPATGREPVAVLATDLNGDGIIDIVTADATDGTLSLYLNDGNANLTALAREVVGGEPYGLAALGNHIAMADRIGSRVVVLRKTGTGRLAVDSVHPTGIEPIAIGVADVNNDGRLDILTANDIGQNVSLLLANSTGFDAPRNTPLGGVPGALTLGDFDVDGRTDFAVTLPLVDQIAVYRQAPVGQFQVAFEAAVDRSPRAILLADDQIVRVTGDSLPDLLVLSDFGSTLTIFQGRPFGTTPPFAEISRFAVSKGASAFAAAEIDRDADAFAEILVAGQDAGRFMVLRGRGAGSYIGAVTFSTDLAPAAIALIDFDGDSLNDIATANQAGNTITLLRGNGVGNVRRFADIPVLVAPSLLVSGELTGDSIADLLVASEFNGTAAVYRGDGAGGFTATREIFLAGAPVAVVLGDVNGDGRLDAAFADRENSTIEIYVDLRTSGFPAFVLPTSGEPSAVALADLNDDGLVDVLATIPSRQQMQVFYQVGGNRFAAPLSFSTGTPASKVAVADFDGDRRLDVLTASHSTSALNLMTGIVGGFAAPRRFALDEPPIGLAVEDFNLDGSPDIAVVSDMSGRVTMLAGDGRGNFPRRTVWAAAVEPLAFVAGQVNNDVARGDLMPDVVVADYLTDRVTILRNISRVAAATPTVRPTSTPRIVEEVGGGGCEVDPGAPGAVLWGLLALALLALAGRQSGRRA